MNVIVVDDERIVLAAETAAVKRGLPDSEVYSFQKANEAINFAEETKMRWMKSPK